MAAIRRNSDSMSAILTTNENCDSSIIVRPSRVEREKCGGCYQRSSKPMKICGACKSIKYCSKTCQATDWKRHKIECTNNVKYEIGISKADDASMFPPYASSNHLPTFGKMDEMLRRWVKFHDFVLMAATIHALRLKQDFSRFRTHMLWLQLSHRCFKLGEPSKYFRIAEAEVVAISDVMIIGKDEQWMKALKQFFSMSDRTAGAVAAVVIECPPLGPQIMPVGSLTKHHLEAEALTDWKDILIGHVEKGERTLHFGL